MMDLDALIAAVEAGAFPLTWKEVNAAGVAQNSCGLDCRGDAWDAFNGSLDAALRLHEALLPGWAWANQNGSANVWPLDAKFERVWDVPVYSAESTTPARSWLLAILRALKEKGQ